MNLFSSQLVITDPSKLPGTRSTGVINEMKTGHWILHTRRRADGTAISLSLLHDQADVYMRDNKGDLSSLETAYGQTFTSEEFEVTFDKAIAFIDIAAYIFSREYLGVEQTTTFIQTDVSSKVIKGYAHPELKRTFDAGYMINPKHDERIQVRPSVLRDGEGCAVAVFLYLH